MDSSSNSYSMDLMDMDNKSYSILEGSLEKLDLEIPEILRQLLKVSEEKITKLEEDLREKEDQISKLYRDLEEKESSAPGEFPKDSRTEESKTIVSGGPGSWTQESQEWYNNLERILDIYQEKISSLESLLEKKQTELDRSEERVSTLKEDNLTLGEKLGAALSSGKKLLEDKINLDVDMAVIKMENLDIVESEERQRLRIKIQELENMLREKEEIGAKMAEELALANSNLKISQESELELKDSLGRKEIALAESLGKEVAYRSELQILQEQVTTKIKRLEGVESDLERRKEEMAGYVLREEDLVREVKALQDEVLELKEELSSRLAQTENSYVGFKTQLQASLEKEQELSEELALANSWLRDLKSSDLELKEELTQKRLEIQAFLGKEERFRSEVILIRKNLEAVQASEQQLHQELYERVADNENLRTDLKLALEKINHLKTVQSELRQQLQDGTKAKESLEKSQEELQENSQKKIDALVKEKEDLVHRLSNLRNEVNELKQKNFSKEAAQLDLHNTIVEDLKLRIKKLEDVHSSLKISHNELQQDWTAQKTQIEDSASRESKLSEELKMSKLRCIKLVQVQEKARLAVEEELEGKKKDFQEVNLQLSNALKELEEVRRRNSSKKQELLQLQNQVDEFIGKRSTAIKENKELKSEIQSLTELLGEAQKRVKEEIERTNTLKTTIQELRDQIKLLEKKNQEYKENIQLVEEQKVKASLHKPDSESTGGDPAKKTSRPDLVTVSKELSPRKTKDATKRKTPGEYRTPTLKVTRSKSKIVPQPKLGKASVLTRRTPVKRGRSRKTVLDMITIESSSDSDYVTSSTHRRAIDSPNIDLSMTVRASSRRQKLDPKKIYTPYPS